MLDLKALIDDQPEARRRLGRRGEEEALARLVALDEERRALVTTHNELRHKQKELSKAFGERGADPEKMVALRAELKDMSAEVKDLEQSTRDADEAIRQQLLMIPNLPQDVVPEGRSEADNVLVRTWGEAAEHDFDAVEHDVLGERLGILDFDAAARLSGSGFTVYRGLGARLERALAQFMLDLHGDEHGYEEVLTPFIVKRECMVGTNQLPKFEADAFRTDDDLFLIPTAEVPVTNLYREQLLRPDQVPIKHVAFSPCFRREAGSYGRDVRGLTRVHQFQKVELVQLVEPERSEAAHLALTGHAERVLQLLEAPYRVMELCAGDLGFGASRCFDLEVWLPVQGRYREISSCSNFQDYQARRADIRYRPEAGAKPRYVHTINGSGLAIGRTVMAILENHQQADGSVRIPEALQPYMRVDRIAPK